MSTLKKKIAVAALAATTMAGSLAVTTTDASAYWRHGYNGGAVAAGVVGGLALGALAAGAARPYYGPGYGYYAPAPAYYGYGDCYVAPRRVWVDGWGWRIRRVTVCE